MKIKIQVNNNIIGLEANISSKTWNNIKEHYGDILCFPKGNEILIGEIFLKCYMLRVVDNDITDGILSVSKDVKELFYNDKDLMELPDCNHFKQS